MWSHISNFKENMLVCVYTPTFFNTYYKYDLKKLPFGLSPFNNTSFQAMMENDSLFLPGKYNCLPEKPKSKQKKANKQTNPKTTKQNKTLT